jgi:DNA topoisomerase VI subunit B
MSHTRREPLQRTVFTTSRLLEFFDEKELTMQIGHGRALWPLALLKEEIDNGVDAAESIGVPPQIHVTVAGGAVTVRDNGPGIPEGVVEGSLNYAVRVSDKNFYLTPTRGQLGIGLKSLWAAPFVLHGESGVVEVEAHGTRHRVVVSVDRIRQTPEIRHTTEPSAVKTGTAITVHWPEQACLLGSRQVGFVYRAGRLLADYAAFNPHACFALRGPGDPLEFQPTAPGWGKWMPDAPPCPYWYDEDRLVRLIAAYVAAEQAGGPALTVRDFLAKFAGLSGTQRRKAILQEAGLAGAWLRDLVKGGDVDRAAARALLAAMQAAVKPVPPRRLGVLGKQHLSDALVRHYGADPESVRYQPALGVADGLPFVLEVVFGVNAADGGGGRQVAMGLNWTPALRVPCEELFWALQEARADEADPLTVLCHLACPRLEFTDRGKGRLDLPAEIEEALRKCVSSVAKRWREAKRRADRQGRLEARQLEELRKANRKKLLSRKEAAFRAMTESYLQASDSGRLPAKARQIMYRARPVVLRLTGGKFWKNTNTFTQKVLPQFMEAHPDLTAAWDVVFDARGHLVEPHMGRSVELGTLQVRSYISRWLAEPPPEDDLPTFTLNMRVPTNGPAQRYRFALFVEKEGFGPLLDRARIAERYDVAIMSTKGMSSTAARRLVDDLSAQGVTILVLRDFDRSGFSIVHTLRSDGPRYKFRNQPKVIDIGLRLRDVREMNLTPEEVEYRRAKKDPRIRLIECGATQEEADFLVRQRPDGSWGGLRVELNEMTSALIIAFIERKFAEHGVQTVVPDGPVLEAAYRRLWRAAAHQEAINQAVAKLKEEEIPPPDASLGQTIAERIQGTPVAWDAALAKVVAEERARLASGKSKGKVRRARRTKE